MIDSVTNNISNLKPLVDFSKDYHNDEGLRSRIDGGDLAPLVEALDMQVPQGMEVRVFCNTADTFYLTRRENPSKMLQDNELISISGGSTASSAGTIGTAGSWPSCLSSASTLGCAGSAGG